MSDQQPSSIDVLGTIASSSAAMVAQLALALGRQDILNEAERVELAKHMRKIAEGYEAFGNDLAAVEFWTASRMIERP